MSKTKSEGQIYTGIVVNNTDDPKQMGRVRVMVPQLHPPHFTEDKMPWCQIAMQPGHDGQSTTQVPPQVGSTVMIRYPSGSKASGWGIVLSVLNGVYQDNKLQDNMSLNGSGWLALAQSDVPGTYGLPKTEQITNTNATGKEKVTTTVSNDKDAPSIRDKAYIQSHGIPVSTVQLYDVIEKVSTAVQEATSSMNSALAALIPGTSFSLSQLNSLLSELPDFSDLENAMGKEAHSALESILSMLGSSTPQSGTNFLQKGIKMNSATFPTQALEALQNSKTFAQVETTLRSFVEDASVRGLDSLANVATTVESAFGNLDVQIDKNGNISVSIPDSIQTLIDAFSNATQGVENAVGTLLSKSDILSDNYKRLPTDVQNAFTSAFEDFGTEIGAILEATKTA